MPESQKAYRERKAIENGSKNQEKSTLIYMIWRKGKQIIVSNVSQLHAIMCYDII